MTPLGSMVKYLHSIVMPLVCELFAEEYHSVIVDLGKALHEERIVTASYLLPTY